ncbi:MAG TPA: carbohydrate porin [Candidatus Acidoferrales bacterium]|nr:carbohydrate porin [Candidatus Acidoferrales bacterium]
MLRLITQLAVRIPWVLAVCLAAPSLAVAQTSQPATTPAPAPPRNTQTEQTGAQSTTPPTADSSANQPTGDDSGPITQNWNFHAQVTETVQGVPSFRTLYSGQNSLNSNGEIEETFTSDLFFGARLWQGGEIRVDGLVWQGYGLSHTEGIEAFPNGDAYKLGTTTPYFMFAHLFIRQTISLGGKRESVSDGSLTLAGEQDISRLTFTLGRFSPTDMFDHNTYAQDAHTQFMNWAMQTNLAWDFPSDSVGYTTGIAVELNQPKWAVRYGFFQLPSTQNGFTTDDQILMWPHRGSDGPFLRSWGTAMEFERRYANTHPGAIRLLAWLDEENMIGYREAASLLEANGSGANLSAARAFRNKYGFGLNWEQRIATNIGVFSRLGWNNGQAEGWMYTDANWTASFGMSIQGAAWGRPNDSFGLACVTSGASSSAQKFLEAGGLGILNGDGALTYGSEKVMEVYYNYPIRNTVHATLDYEFVDNPAFNRARGPVSVIGIRLHWQF